MLFDLITPLIGQLSNVTVDKWEKQQAFVNTRLAIRDRLRREARLNAELLKRIKGRECVVKELSTGAVREIFEMPFPLYKFLNLPITGEARQILDKNKQFKKWTEKISHEADLLERLWQRTRMLLICWENDEGTPNVSYVRVLNIALAKNLKEN